jgi:hypothetical protein
MRFQVVLIGFFASLVMGVCHRFIPLLMVTRTSNRRPTSRPYKLPSKAYGVEKPEWEVELTPGGEMVKANGTIQEVVAHLKALNPNFEKEYPVLNNTELAAVPNNLSKRYDVESYFCMADRHGASGITSWKESDICASSAARRSTAPARATAVASRAAGAPPFGGATM